MKRTLIKAAIACLLVGLPFVTAFALSVDQTKTMQKRFFGSQQTHYYRVTYNWNDAGTSTGTAQKFGALNKNAFITDIACYVTTAFNGTSPVLSFGYTTAGNEIMAASGGATVSVDLTSATYQHPTAAAGLGQKFTSAGDITLYSKLSITGSPSAGLAACVIQYAADNDL